jgi:hypothetical protein
VVYRDKTRMETAMFTSDTEYFHAARLLLTSTAVIALAGCASIGVPVAGDGRFGPIDSTRAVRLARRNVCGEAAANGDTACVLMKYESGRGYHRVVLERRPPIGRDVLVVTLRRGGERIDVEPTVVQATGLR